MVCPVEHHIVLDTNLVNALSHNALYKHIGLPKIYLCKHIWDLNAIELFK